jgi:hypothetical protein
MVQASKDSTKSLELKHRPLDGIELFGFKNKIKKKLTKQELPINDFATNLPFLTDWFTLILK